MTHSLSVRLLRGLYCVTPGEKSYLACPAHFFIVVDISHNCTRRRRWPTCHNVRRQPDFHHLPSDSALRWENLEFSAMYVGVFIPTVAH